MVGIYARSRVEYFVLQRGRCGFLEEGVAVLDLGCDVCLDTRGSIIHDQYCKIEPSSSETYVNDFKFVWSSRLLRLLRDCCSGLIGHKPGRRSIHALLDSIA